nr:hypothetical protein [Tanacetum cinerariifolium]
MVKMFRPRTLHEAYGLAKTKALNNKSLEEKINKGKGNSRNTRNYSNFNITPPVNAYKLPLLPTPKPAKKTFTKPNEGPRRLTSKELEYKHAKGECFWCTENGEGRRAIRQAFQGRGTYNYLTSIDKWEMVQNYQPRVSSNSDQVQLDHPWYELTQTYSEVFQTPKGLPPTRPFDPGEMDQSKQDATWEFLDELQLRIPDFSEHVSCGQEIA